MFVEQVSSVGVTGARSNVSSRVQELLGEIKEVFFCENLRYVLSFDGFF